jgi:glyoxylase-like metal-dependent hydrolase (beta-lactamase superfamily II)
VLIDPGDEVEQLLVFAERQALRIGHILLTHAHVDHITGVAAAKRALACPSTSIATICFSTRRR